MMKLRPERVVKTAMRSLGKRPSVIAGTQYRFFAWLTKRVLSRAAGTWLFGFLMRRAFVDRSLLEPSEPAPTRSTSISRTRSVTEDHTPTAASLAALLSGE